MPGMPPSKKLRRFFTTQSLRDPTGDLWLEPSETHHLKDSIRLKPGDTCLVTDGEGREAEALIHEFSGDGRTHLQILRAISAKEPGGERIRLRLIPTMLRKGKTDFLVEKAQELGAFELWPISSEHCEIKVAEEKAEKMVDRWHRIAREASKQSGALRVVHITGPRGFKEAVAAVPAEEPLVIFHPSRGAIAFPEWIRAIQTAKSQPGTLNLFFGPEGGFSETEIDWVQWKRKGKNFFLVGLGEVIFKADTALIGVVATLKFSGIA